MKGVPAVSLRRVATAADARQLFEWRNHPFIWSRGSSQRTVSWAEHEAWFAASLQNPDRVIYLIEQAGVPVGMVRFDRESEEACVISAYLAQEYVGRGLGVAAIVRACGQVFDLWPVAEVRAFVRRDNIYGLSGFRKAGFGPSRAARIADHEALHLLRREKP